MKIHIGRYPKDSSKERIMRVKIEKWDTWSMDHTLALIILPMLKQLKASNHGAPYTEDIDVPEELRSTAAKPKENEWDTDEFHFQRWDWIMDEMIWAFEQIVDENADSQFYSGETDMLWQPLDKDHNPIGEPYDYLHEDKEPLVVEPAFYTMVKGPNDTFEVDREGMDKWDKRIKNGLVLFGKYYQGLWD